MIFTLFMALVTTVLCIIFDAIDLLPVAFLVGGMATAYWSAFAFSLWRVLRKGGKS